MHTTIVLADDVGSQLLRGVSSTQFLQFIVTLLFAFAFPITSAAVINYLERKVMAWMQDRQGPLHVGPQGRLQLLAGIGKMFLKEDIHPDQTVRSVFLLAPSLLICPLVSYFAVLSLLPFLGLTGT